MKESQVIKAYELAKERYAEIGIDTDKVLEQLQNFHLSMHCWQADDVKGFEVQAGALSGGIQSTGNYPGAARNIDELRADVLKAKSLIPGTHRLNRRAATSPSPIPTRVSAISGSSTPSAAVTSPTQWVRLRATPVS